MNALVRDMSLSGLHPTDIAALPLGTVERSALDIPHGVPGYVIPYFDIEGMPTPFYRARLFDFNTKYRQPKNSGNHVYFPHNFKATLNGHPYVLITEGEKKAASANRIGIPAIALGGVYSWRNRNVSLPDTAVISQGGRRKVGGQAVDLAIGQANKLQIKLPEDFDADRLMSEYAQGFENFVELAKQRGLTILITFDCTCEGTLHPDIQKAAARLGMELRFLGVPFPKIKVMHLKPTNKLLEAAEYNRQELLDKIGLDDYIVTEGRAALEGLIEDALRAGPSATSFPIHPNMHLFVSKKLQAPRLSRKETGLLALSIIADLDARGSRLRSRDGLMYYFDRSAKELMRATSPMARGPIILDDAFNTLLYAKYNLTTNDHKVLKWIAAQYAAEEPIQHVEPKRAMFTKDDALYYQINKSQFITCDATHPARLYDNGEVGTLFQSGLYQGAGANTSANTTNEISGEVLHREMLAQLKAREGVNSTIPIHPWWFDTLKATRLKGLPKDDRQARILTLLFYVSPWLFRWRNTQLPIEIATGEAGSGKSTLYGLRQTILYGAEDLKNIPQSIRDWHASVASTGGLHVTDNVDVAMDKTLKTQLSNEMCRIITEPVPTIEMRRFYTETELVKIPINVVFAVTAIAMPFHQTDIIQRSFHVQLDKGTDEVQYDANWALRQIMDRGGRAAWMAHHLIVLHEFFKRVNSPRWSATYKAKYRLVNLEQSLMIMAEIFGWDSSWIPEYLTSRTANTVSESDWVMQGVKAYVDHVIEILGKRPEDIPAFTAADIASWCSSEEDFQECIPLCSSRRLGRYISQHKSTIAAITGLIDAGLKHNKQHYKVRRL